MFIIKYFKKSIFSLRGIYDLKDESFLKILIYFFLISMISLVPYNIEIIKEKGFKMGFVSELYSGSTYDTFKNSRAEKIGMAGLRVSADFEMEIYEFKELKLVLDYYENYQIEEGNLNKNLLILKKETMIYYNKNKSYMTGNYESFDRDYRFSDFSANLNIYLDFYLCLEKGFYSYLILFSVLNYTGSSLGMYLLMILLMAVILSFLKYGFSKSLRFSSIVKIIILSMTLPSMIVFFLGWFGLFALSPVIMNFMMGGISLLVLIKVAKNRLEIETGK